MVWELCSKACNPSGSTEKDADFKSFTAFPSRANKIEHSDKMQ